MYFQEFSQLLNLDEQTKLAAESQITVEQQDDKIIVPAIIYLCCQSAQFQTMDGEIKIGNGVTLTQIIRSLDVSVDIEQFLIKLQEIPKRNALYSAELQQNINKANMSFRLYKKFEMCFNQIEKLQNPEATPQFECSDNNQYIQTLKKVAWLLYIMIRKQITQYEEQVPYLMSCGDTRNTVALVSIITLVIVNIPEGYTIKQYTTRECRSDNIGEIIKILISTFLDNVNLNDEIEYYLNLSTQILTQLMAVINHKQESIVIGEMSNDLTDFNQTAENFQESIIDQTFRKLHKYYNEQLKDDLDEECFLRQKSVFTPKKKRVPDSLIDTVDRKSNDQLYNRTPLKQNKFSAASEKHYFEIKKQPQVPQTPVSKVMLHYQWLKNQTKEEHPEILSILDEVRTGYSTQVSNWCRDITVKYFNLTKGRDNGQCDSILRLYFNIFDRLVNQKREQADNALLSNKQFLFALLALTIYIHQFLQQVYVNLRHLVTACSVSSFDIMRVIQNFAGALSGSEAMTQHLFELERSILLSLVWQTKDETDHMIRILRQNNLDCNKLQFCEIVLLKRFTSHLGLRVTELSNVFNIGVQDQVYEMLSNFYQNPVFNVVFEMHVDQLIICGFYIYQKHLKQPAEFRKFKEHYVAQFPNTKNMFGHIVEYYNDKFVDVFKQTVRQPLNHITIDIPREFVAQSPLVKGNRQLYALGENLESPQVYSKQLANRLFKDPCIQKFQ